MKDTLRFCRVLNVSMMLSKSHDTNFVMNKYEIGISSMKISVKNCVYECIYSSSTNWTCVVACVFSK